MSRGKHLKQEDLDFIRKMDEAGASIMFKTQEEYVEGLRIALDRETLDPHTYRDAVKNGYRKASKPAKESAKGEQPVLFYTGDQIEDVVRKVINGMRGELA